jgi:IMP dehydrogenase
LHQKELIIMSDYDNVFLVPKEISYINSRNDVDLFSDFHNIYPIFSSPMEGISGVNLVVEMGKNNCLGILHRFGTYPNRYDKVNAISDFNVNFGVAIKFNEFESELDFAEYAVNQGASLICLDLAHGGLSDLKNRGNALRERLPYTALMCGNVVTKEWTEFLKTCGFTFIRVGIGSSRVCATRDVTGVGRNQLAAIAECSTVDDVYTVSDGGISIPGNAVKSFATGSDFVMLGSVLAYANEAENTNKEEDTFELFGMASKRSHELNNKQIKSIEGKHFFIDSSEKKPLKDILDQFLWGIRSGCTYLNSKSYKDIQHNCRILPVNETF